VKKKLPALILVIALVCTVFSSCGYRISIEKKEKDTTEEATTEAVVTQSLPPVSTEYTEQTTTYIIDNSPTLVQDRSYTLMNISKDDCLAIYRNAMNDVKTVAPGFTKTETQRTSDVQAGSGRTQLANSILNLVGQSILNNSDGSGKTVVSKGDTSSAKNIFPLFGSDYGCALTDSSIVKSAQCYTDGSTYKIILTLEDALNPDMNSAFAQIMDPADISTMKDGIAQYLVVLDYSQYQFDINYTGCEITCVIDKATSRMTSLSHKMVMEVAININLNLIVLQTSAVRCTGTITDHVDYTDFKW